MVTAYGKVKEVTVSAKVIRADGTIEDLGVICRSEPQKRKLVNAFIDKLKRSKR